MKILAPYIQVKLEERKSKSSILLSEDEENKEKNKECIVVVPYEGNKICKEGDTLVLHTSTQLIGYKDKNDEYIYFVRETDIIAVIEKSVNLVK